VDMVVYKKYDVKNRLVNERLYAGTNVSYEYDANDNKTKATYSDGLIMTWKFEGNNRVRSDSSLGAWEKWEYDSENRLIHEETSQGANNRWVYGGNGKLLEYWCWDMWKKFIFDDITGKLLRIEYSDGTQIERETPYCRF